MNESPQKSKCWLFGDGDEMINPIISECGKLAEKNSRHN